MGTAWWRVPSASATDTSVGDGGGKWERWSAANWRLTNMLSVPLSMVKEAPTDSHFSFRVRAAAYPGSRVAPMCRSRAAVGSSVGSSVGPSVGPSVGSSVGAPEGVVRDTAPGLRVHASFWMSAPRLRGPLSPQRHTGEARRPAGRPQPGGSRRRRSAEQDWQLLWGRPRKKGSWWVPQM